MKGIHKVVWTTVAVLALVAFAMPADANTIKLNRDTSQYSGPSGGGEFRVTSFDGYYEPQGTGVNVFGGLFQSFCIQADEGIDTSLTWNWKESDQVVHATKAPLNLKDEVAYLFTHFWNGTLGSATSSTADDYVYATTGGRVSSADDLQVAFWNLMGWTDFNMNTRSKAWYDEAVAAVKNGYTNSGVRVLNLTRVDSAGNVVHAQDMLILVPLPSAALGGMLLLAGLGMAVGLKRRRRK